MPTPTDRFGLDTYDPGESWDHTDTVQFLDESAIEVDTIANRPTDGSYDGELFFATDQRILYQWDAGGSSWDVELGLGVDGTPVPGTSHFEALEADSATINGTADVVELLADTLAGADLANASENQILVAQGDGSLAVETQAQGPNPYDQAQSFEETSVIVETTDTTIRNGSVELSDGGLYVDDFEEGDIDGWTGDTDSFEAQNDVALTGSFSGELVSSSESVSVSSPSVGESSETLAVRQQIGSTTSSLADYCRLEVKNSSDTRLGYLEFEDNSQKISWYDGSETDTGLNYEADVSQDIKFDWDFPNDEVVINIDGSAVGPYSLENSVSSWDYLTIKNYTGGSENTRSVYNDNIPPLTSGSATIEWDRGIPTDIFEWDIATYTKTLDGETVDVFVAYDDPDDGWTRTNDGDPIDRNYSLNEDPNITTDVDVRIETELSRDDTANNPTLDSCYRSWLV